MAQQTINLGAAPDDGTGDTLRAGGDKINDNFDELYDEALKFKGSTDCSTNPNYPAALKGDAYRVSVAGKIGGASGVDVEIADLYFATADNAGGDQATVGTSWSVLQGNITSYLPLSGGTLTGDLIVPDEAYDATAWNGSLEVPTKNAVRDKIESLSAGGIAVEDEGVSEGTGLTTLNFTGAGVSVTVVGSEAEVIIPGGGGGIDVEDEGVAEATGATTLNFVGAGVTAADMGGGVVDVTISGGGGGVDVEDEGVAEATGATILNFTGAGVTATDVGGGQVDVAIPGPWGNWTELTFGSPASHFGKTLSPSNETFTVAATDRIEIEIEVEKASGSEAIIAAGVGANAYYIGLQGDHNNVLYRYNGGSSTSILAVGVNSTRGYGGTHHIRFVINVQSSTDNFIFAEINDERMPTAANQSNTTFSMVGTLTVYYAGTLKRARARVIN